MKDGDRDYQVRVPLYVKDTLVISTETFSNDSLINGYFNYIANNSISLIHGDLNNFEDLDKDYLKNADHTYKERLNEEEGTYRMQLTASNANKEIKTILDFLNHKHHFETYRI